MSSCPNNTDAETPENCCPSKFCDDRLSGLPTKNRIGAIIGVSGRCLERFHPNKVGLVFQDGAGGSVLTVQPRLPMPIARSLLLDEFGKPIPLTGGGFQEDIPPPMDYLIGAQCDGLQFRVKGTGGVRQSIIWNGCKYEHEAAPLAKLLDDYQYVGPSLGHCGVHEMVLVVQPDGSVLQGYRSKPSLPPGVMMMWGGAKASLPTGWIACEGQELETDVYVDLFTVWGYSYGGSAGLFRAPDTRGRFVRFVDEGAGIDPDALTRTALHTGGATGDDVGSYQGDSFGGTGKKFENDAANDTPFASEVRPINFSAYCIAFAGCIEEP